MSRQSRYCDHFIYGCLLLFAFALPISIALSQGALILALLGWGGKMLFERRLGWEPSPFDYPLLAFLAAAVISAFFGVDTLRSLAGMRTFWTFLIIYVVCNNVAHAGRVKMLAAALLAGATAMALWQGVASYIQLAAGVHQDLLGSMTRAGQLMIFSGIAVAGLFYQKEPRGKLVFLLVAAVLLASGILQFKRGAWFALFIVLLVQCMFRSKKAVLPVIALAVAVSCLYQPVRERLYGIAEEFSPESTGRIAMWRTVPAMLGDNPMGIGLDNVRTEMYRYDPDIELKEGKSRHTHLHNSYLQVLVELGPLGLAGFLWFSAVFLVYSFRLFRRIEGHRTFEKSFLLGAFSAFIGFLVNGIVEDNFGDSQVAMAVFFLMGLTLVIGRVYNNRLPGMSPSAGGGESARKVMV